MMTVPAWPWNGGEMAARIRGYHWAATSLGPVEGWPESLRAVVDLMLAAPQLATLAVGPERIFLYNDEAAGHYRKRHPGVLGCPLAAAFPHEFVKVASFYDRVFAGEVVYLPAQPADPVQSGPVDVLDAHLVPVRDNDGRVIAAYMTGAVTPNGEYSAGIGVHDTGPQGAARIWTAVERARAEGGSSESEERYRSLFDAVSLGLAVNQLVRDRDGRVVDARLLDLNPAYEAQAGIDRLHAVGRLASEVFPLVGPSWLEMAERVVATRRPERLERFVADSQRWFKFTMAAFEGRDRFAVVYEDITEQKLAESTLRKNQEWQIFLLGLSDDIRAQSDEYGIGALVTRRMAEHLHLDRCFVAQLDPEQDRVIVGPEYHRPALGPASGEYRLADFSELVRQVQTQTVVFDDVLGDPALTDFDKAASKAIDIGAFIAAGVRLGSERVRWALVGVSAVPRAWAPGDVALMENVAERSWVVIERSRHEAALRESRETLAADLMNAELLRNLAERLVTEENVATIYDDILSTAIIVAQAEGGTVQTYDLETNSLSLLTTQNFSRVIVDRFHKVDASSKTACGVALRTGRQAFVDFEREVDDPGCLLLVDAGFRTALAIPLVSRTGKKLGMLNTYWRAAGHRSDQRQLRFLELIARQAADLIEQRQAQSELRESKGRLALAFNTLPLGIAILDVLGGVETANGEMRRFLPTGITPSRDPARSARWRGWHADGRVASLEDYPGAQALRGSAVFPGMQMLYRGDDDREIYTEVLSAPLRDDDGRVNGAIIVVVDVDRVKRSEEAARASEERLRQFGEASHDILWIRDAETLQWTYLTAAFEAIYGLSREDALTGDN